MKNRYLLVFIILILSARANNSFAIDYFPEMGLDPFYSSLNPAYINNEEMPEGQDSIIKIFKNLKKEKNNNKEQKEQKKAEQKLSKAEKKQAISDKKQARKEAKEIEKQSKTEVNQQKSSLSKKELEKELLAEEKEKQKEINKEIKNQKQKKNGFFVFKSKNKANGDTAAASIQQPDIEFTADYMEYFPDRYEVEAVGNAVIKFQKSGSTLKAHKIIFNYDKNIIRANENVILTSADSETEGDFVKIDLSKGDGWIENPITKMEDIHLNAKEAYIFSDRIEEYDGVAKVFKDETMNLGGRSFASYVDQGMILPRNDDKLEKDDKGIYKLKTNIIEIDSKEEHEVITIKNADLYLKNHKIAKIPSIKIVTNKQRANIETNIPEFGSQSMLGMHFGPAVVLNVPGGSTLKLAPMIVQKDNDWGIGGIARYKSKRNMTEIAYGTPESELLIRGKYKITDGLTLTYSRFTNQDEWFLGYRMPKYSTQLSYSKTNYVKDLKLHFSQLYSAGVFVDNFENVKTRDAESRFRWMTQTYKPVFKYMNEEGSIGMNVGLVAQTAATVYTTGNTLGLVRVGPAVNTQVGPWAQSLIYYQTGEAGTSPFVFDRYRYGRSNFVLIESLKVCRLLKLGYLASLALNREVATDDVFQENRFVVSIGPDYAKVTIGYDAIRKNTMFVFSMLVGTKDSDITYKKAIIKNPDRFGKTPEKQSKKKKKKSYKKYLKKPVKNKA